MFSWEKYKNRLYNYFFYKQEVGIDTYLLLRYGNDTISGDDTI